MSAVVEVVELAHSLETGWTWRHLRGKKLVAEGSVHLRSVAVRQAIAVAEAAGCKAVEIIDAKRVDLGPP